MTVEPMPAPGTVGVVIVSYQTKDPIRECLRSLLTHGGELVTQVVVVDNNSNDGSIAMLEQEFPDVDVLPLGDNLGFAVACNRGAATLDTEFVLFLNPDTEMHPGTVDALVDASRRHPRAGQIGGRTLDDDDNLDPSSCWGAPSLWSTFCFASLLSTVRSGDPRFDPESLGRWARDTEREVGVVTGCLALMPMSVFHEIGGFDERYFLYGEDIDLSMRVAAAGYSVMITPDASITHSVGAASVSSVERSVLVLKGRMTLFRTQFGPARGAVLRSLYFFGVALRAALPKQQGSAGAGRKAPWRALFGRRKEWWSGYPAVPSTTES